MITCTYTSARYASVHSYAMQSGGWARSNPGGPEEDGLDLPHMMNFLSTTQDICSMYKCDQIRPHEDVASPVQSQQKSDLCMRFPVLSASALLGQLAITSHRIRPCSPGRPTPAKSSHPACQPLIIAPRSPPQVIRTSEKQTGAATGWCITGHAHGGGCHQADTGAGSC